MTEKTGPFDQIYYELVCRKGVRNSEYDHIVVDNDCENNMKGGQCS